MTITNDLLKRIAFAVVGVGLIAYGLWLQSGETTVGTAAPVRNATTAGPRTESSTPALVKVPIKDIRVGTRVPAFNPEVSAAERRGFTEPNWYRWMKLKLEMPKPDGTMLEIEMLRSEDWLIQQLALVVEPEPMLLSAQTETGAVLDSATGAGSEKADETTAAANNVGTGVPLRPIYGHLSELLHKAVLNGNRAIGLVVELDLPEIGLSGPAWIVDLEPSPIVPAGPGQVVTATFKHASANVLDLVLASTPPAIQTVPTEAPSPTTLSSNSSLSSLSVSSKVPSVLPDESIGVTANHPFWSVDRAEFVQAGELMIGERLQTLAGDIHWVQQKLPRPGPEPVYNLEVHDEHVYYVGTSGILAHNAGKSYVSGAYDQLDTLPGFQNHHLLQQKAFPNKINVDSGPVVRVRGKIGEFGSQHNVIHRTLEGFFDVHRIARTRPTIREYLAAMRQAARNSGFGAKEAHQMTDSARRFLSRLQLELDDLIPQVPGRIPVHFLSGGPI